MKITRRSSFTGALNTRELPVTADQLDELDRSGKPIQQVLPHLSADDREFLMTGATPQEWNDFLGGGDE